VGLEREHMARLFEPFEQLGDEAQREGGTGLGLTISRQLIRLMGGEIQVRSQPREGSAFSFDIRVPAVSADPAPTRDPDGLPSGYEGPRRRILIVDDVGQNRLMLLDALETFGFEVCEAANGAEALEVAARLRPDLVLVDLMMPVMDGFETARRLRLDPQLSRIPVVATSASTTPEVEKKSLASGASFFLPKPIEPKRLCRTIGRLLGLRWTYASARTAAP
jgi:CheY-like chemotaxis protein